MVITGIIAQMMTCQLEESSGSKRVNRLTEIKGVLLAKLGERQGHNYHIVPHSDNPVALRRGSVKPWDILLIWDLCASL